MPTARSLPGDLTQNLSSPSCCTNAAVHTVRTLLFDGKPFEHVASQTPAVTSKQPTSNAKVPKKAEQVTRIAKKVENGSQIHQDAGKIGSDQEKLKVATETVNLVLETLSRANSSISASQSSEGNATSSVIQPSVPGRTTGSSVQNDSVRVCLQEKSPNKKRISAKDGKTRASRRETPANCGLSALADCGAVAFRYLESHSRVPRKEEANVAPNYQVEKGILAFVGKLLGLGQFEKALTEARFLKLCLYRLISEYFGSSVPKDKKSKDSALVSNDELNLLLLCPDKKLPSALARVVFDYQIMAVRLASSLTDRSFLVTMLPYLDALRAGSPVKCLLQSAPDQAGTQLKSFSQLLWQVASKVPITDSSASDVPGSTSLQLRTFALQTRGSYMKACNCQTQIESEIISPFYKSLMNFADLSKKTPFPRFRISRMMTDALLGSLPAKFIGDFVNEPIEIHMSRLAIEAGLVEESAYHAERTLTADSSSLSSARTCALTIRIANGRLAELFRLKEKPLKAKDALSKAINFLEGELLGDSADFEDVLRSILELRKAILQLFSSPETDHRLELEDTMHLFLCSSIKLLGKLFCSVNREGDYEKPRELLQDRRALMIYATKPILESTLFSLKRQQMSKSLAWNYLSSILDSCLGILDRISSKLLSANNVPILAPAELTSYRLRISDMYWLFAIRKDDMAHSSSDQRIISLQNACECVKLLDISWKMQSMLPLKMYRLSASLKETQRVEEAARTLVSLIELAIEANVLSEEVVNRNSIPVACPDTKEDHDLGRIVSKALCKLLELKSDNQKKYQQQHLLYDDERLVAEQRGYLLEWQLILLLEISRETNTLDKEATKRDMSQILLEVYDETHFPIRRCRAIILLLHYSSVSEHRAPDDWLVEHARSTIDRGPLESKMLAKDSDLASCQTRWLILLQLCLSVQSRLDMTQILSAAASLWSAEQIPKTLNDETKQPSIEVEVWLSQLELAVDYLDMSGPESQRLSALLLSYQIRSKTDTRATKSVTNSSLSIALQSLRLGHVSMANSFIEKARHWLGTKVASTVWKVRMALAEFESSMAVGDDKNSALRFSKLKLLVQGSEGLSLSKFIRRHCEDKVDAAVLAAEILRAFCDYYIHHGSLKRAIALSKQNVYLLQKTWKALECAQDSRHPSAQIDDEVDVDKVVSGVSQLHVSHTGPESPEDFRDKHHDSKQGFRFWPILRSLVDASLKLGTISKHCGMHQEAIYVIEQAEKAVRSICSQALLGKILVGKSEIVCSSGDSHESWNYLEEASKLYKSADKSMDLAMHHRSLGNYYHHQHQWSTEAEAYFQAELVLDRLSQSLIGEDPNIERQILPLEVATASLSIDGQHGHQRTPPRKPPDRRKPSRNTKSRPKEPKRALPSSADDSENVADEYPNLKIVKSDILRRKAESAIAQNEYAQAAALLSSSIPHYIPPEIVVRHHAALAWLHIREGISHMTGDAVFGMLPESTLSYPATSIVTNSQTEESGADGKGNPRSRKTPSKFQMNAKTDHHVRQTSGMSFIDRLLEAMTLVSDVNPDVLEKCSNFTLYQICAAIGTASMLLASARPDAIRGRIHSLMIPYTIELSKISATLREQLFTEANDSVKKENFGDYSIDCSKELGSISLSQFQHGFLDVIPDQWNVVSISLTADCTHLYVVRYRAGQAPFVLRLPLTRQHAEDPEEETFTYDEAIAELSHIIDASDATVHRAKNNEGAMEAKSAKTQWWTEREELDDRLKTLLLNIENIWLGGFRGVFSQSLFNPELLARFQQSFNNILAKHLPSRQRNRRGQPALKIRVDIHVLELFVGLGDPENHGQDMDEALTDLFYFVVDILQYNGERNAYDEIDFDAMIVETQDALRSYHDALRHEESSRGPSHTILILDNKLHGFPWESLPCLEQQSISRVSSFVDLRDRIAVMKQQQQQQQQMTEASQITDGIRVSRDNGTYFLNPSGDLSKTEARFAKPLSALTKTEPPRWSHITRRVPTEEEFCNALSMNSPTASNDNKDHPPPDPNIFLYFGHGSGLHYIRSKTIKRLRYGHQTANSLSLNNAANNNKESSSDGPSASTQQHPQTTPTCATTLLFGCSSAHLRPAGEFEPTGTPRTYMLAGAPALLGSLWDVTDGDCDRFASGLLKRWGLLKEGVEEFEGGEGVDNGIKKGGGGVRKGRSRGGRMKAKRGRQDVAGEQGGERRDMCLSEAAARARSDCYLRYLNGAAMVVYGVPCFLA